MTKMTKIAKRVESGCRHTSSYRRAVRVGSDGSITFGKLGTGRSTRVVASWCERCGSVEVRGTWRHPMARVNEDR